jgi:CRISPR type I-E-associated protein CasB/Cse2
MTSEAVASDAKPKDPVASIGGHLSVLSTGDHALLRRMYLTGKPAAEGVVIKLLHHAGVAPAEYNRDYPAWRLLVHVAALLSGTGRKNPHSPEAELGSALQAAGYSENRLLRLTAARGAALHDQILLAARILAKAGGGSINLWTLLHLALRDADKAERARVRIAQHYYTAAALSEGNTK